MILEMKFLKPWYQTFFKRIFLCLLCSLETFASFPKWPFVTDHAEIAWTDSLDEGSMHTCTSHVQPLNLLKTVLHPLESLILLRHNWNSSSYFKSSMSGILTKVYKRLGIRVHHEGFPVASDGRWRVQENWLFVHNVFSFHASSTKETAAVDGHSTKL
jgi:hypothetical protein